MAHLVRRRNRRSDVVGAVPGGAGSTPVTAEAATRRSPASARSTVTGVAASAWTPPRSGSFPRTNLGPAGRGPAPGPDRRWQHDHPTPRRHRAARRRLPRREWRATWLLARNRATWCYPWFTLSGHTALWHTSTDAHEHTLTRLVPEGDGVVDAEVIDVSDPAQLRRAAALVREVSYSCTSEWEDELQEVSDFVAARADRLDVDAADRALAEKIAREAVPPNAWVQFDRLDGVVRESRIQTALAGIRAGRDAERGA